MFEMEEFGIFFFVYRRNCFFYFECFMKWLENWLVDIVCVKGFFWFVLCNNMVGFFF